MVVNESKRDWPEDFGKENGNYTCKCVRCKEHFNGHKGRVLCKVCETELEQPVQMYPELNAAIENLKQTIYLSPLVQKILHFFERLI